MPLLTLPISKQIDFPFFCVKELQQLNVAENKNLNMTLYWKPVSELIKLWGN